MMKNNWLWVLLLSACSTPEPAVPGTDPAQELAGIVALAYDPAQIRVGQRAVYRITQQGQAEPRYVKLQAVAADAGDTFWVEFNMPAGFGQMVVKSRVDRAGKLYEQWIGAPGSANPTKVYPRSDGTTPALPKPPGDAQVNINVEDETITVAGRTYPCKKVTTTLTYAGSRTSTMVNWCHLDVPFSFQKENETLGGVVKRVYGRWTMELVDAGQTGARAELEIPKK